MLFVLPLVLPVITALAVVLQATTTLPPLTIAASPLLVLFVLVPLIDALTGQDLNNPRQEKLPAILQRDRWLPRLLALGQFVHLLLAVSLIDSFAESAIVLVVWSLSAGAISAILAINTAHELIHRRNRLDQNLGGVLLSTVAYAAFKTEHVLGHHRWVATDQDPASAPKGMSVYRFVPASMRHTLTEGWRLARLRSAGRWHEMHGWYALSLLWAALASLVAGGAGLVFMLIQALAAIALLETINYIEHYGLRRARTENGFERVKAVHSWNAPYRLSNALLLGLQRHSDHHAWPQRPFSALRHVDEAPRLPAGYASMVWLALAPPLWRQVIHPRLPARRPASTES